MNFMRFVDTHAHIHDKEFAADVDATLDRASAAGVELTLTLGTNLESSRRAIVLAQRDGRFLAAAGVHPHDAGLAAESDLVELEALCGRPEVAVVGEIGLDFYRDLSPRDQQVRVLRTQLEIAQHVAKPISVHGREAHGELLPALRAHSAAMGGALPDGRRLGMLHYFSEDASLAATYIALGYLISIHTSVTHPKAHMLRDVARAIPIEAIVIETDSPYGAPQSVRGKRNEPAYVVEAAKMIAELRSMTLEDVAAATTANAMKLLCTSVPASGV